MHCIYYANTDLRGGGAQAVMQGMQVTALLSRPPLTICPVAWSLTGTFPGHGPELRLGLTHLLGGSVSQSWSDNYLITEF